MRLQNSSESLFHCINCGLRGLKLVVTPEFRRYVVGPVLLNLIVFGLAFWLSGTYFAAFLEWLIPGWLDWLRWLLWPVFGISLVFFALFCFSLVANMLGCLFYGGLARKVESRLLSTNPDGPKSSGEPSWIAGVSSEIKRLTFFLNRAIPLLLLLLIPGVNLIVPFVWLCFSAWFLGMEYVAYSLDGSGLTFPEQRRLMAPYRVHVTLFGGLLLMGLAVPIFNLVVPPAAVIGATLYVQNKKPNNLDEHRPE